MMDAGIKGSALDELESHLRDDIGQQARSGGDEAQAFKNAVRRIGEGRNLKAEYQKINRVSTLLEKLMIGACAMFIAFAVLLSSVTIWICFRSPGERVMASMSVAAVLLVAIGWKHAVPFLPVIAGRGGRWTAGLTCWALGIVACNLYCGLILPHFQKGTDPEVPSITFWAVFFIAIFACSGLGFMMDDQERRRLGIGTKT